MWLLLVSVVALFLGILVLPVAQKKNTILAFVDGFVLVAVGGLVLFELLPESLSSGGSLALLAAIVGFVLPTLMESMFKGGKSKSGSFLFFSLSLLSLLGLLAHVLMDGMALATPAHQKGVVAGAQHLEFLAVGVVLHRLPVGLAIGWFAIPRWGLPRALLVAGLVALFTLVGFFLGNQWLTGVSLRSLSIFQALVSGSLIHFAWGQGPAGLSLKEAKEKRLAGIGGMVGLGTVLLLFFSHVHHPGNHAGHPMLDAFWKLSLESAPALAFAFLGGGLMHAFLKPMSMRWLQSGSRLMQGLKGMLFGLPLPICSCGVTPLYRSLVRAGVPGTAGMAFLIATPELGIDALLISVPLLGGKLTVIRLVTAAVAALAVAWFVSLWMPPPTTQIEESQDQSDTPSAPLSQRLKGGLRYGATELVDHTMPWILLGLVVAAILSPLLPAQQLGAVSPWLQVPLMAVIGLPVYVCASGTTPFVAVLLMKGLSPGAALAFLLTGPATNVTTFGILRNLHGRKVALLFGGSMIVVTCLLGWGVNGFFGAWTAPTIMAKHAHGHVHANLWQLVSIGVVGFLLLWALFRNGPRFLLGQIVESYNLSNAHVHDADCGQDCGDGCAPEPIEKSCCDHEHGEGEQGTAPPPAEEEDSSCCGSKHCGE